MAPLFEKNQPVVHRQTRKLGVVLKDADLDGGDYWYLVRFDAGKDVYVEHDLELVPDEDESIESLAMQGKWGLAEAIRCAVALQKIKHQSTSTIYTYRSQKILFHPYQYKPLLAFLRSADRRLLIADEVGLGKTIEAGLIMSELEARQSLDRVLIVCPSRLRNKWQRELNEKFHQDFQIFDKRGLLSSIERLTTSSRRSRFRGIVSMQTMRGLEARDAVTTELGQLDLLIVDEAHHARNRTSQTSRMLIELCQVSDGAILLTATPLHLKSEDLYTLLNALRPDEFLNPTVFEWQLQRHAGIHQASRLVRQKDPSSFPEIIEIISGIFRSGRLGFEEDPRAEYVMSELENHIPETDRDWVELERAIQDLHPLGTIISRTKKRDVLENAPVRKAHVVKCEWTSHENEEYHRLVGNEGNYGWFRSRLDFGQIQRARQAASCLPAAFRKSISASNDDEADEAVDILPSELEDFISTETGASSIDLAAWEGPDSKFEKLFGILKRIWKQDPSAKVLIFAFFKGTTKYLEERLTEEKVKTLRIDGDVKSEPNNAKQDIRGQRLQQFEEDETVRVMVSTEVGSEGLDFQYCHHVVNYDLPWNPMVVEQRIGRIDRLGQEKDKIFIHNLVVEGTVEDRILSRLYTRIGVFERSIGDLEAILGQTIKKIRSDFLNAELTPEEAEERMLKASDAIARRESELERLEKEAKELFGHEQYIKDQMKKVGRLGRYVSQTSVLALLRTYLAARHPTVRIWEEEKQIYGLRLTDDLRYDIADASRKMGERIWSAQGKQLLITTDGETSFKRKHRVELVNVSHPLLQAAVEYLSAEMENVSARLGQVQLSIEASEPDDLQTGIYVVALYSNRIKSARQRLELFAVASNIQTNEILTTEDSERLLHLCIEDGEQWEVSANAPPMTDEVYNAIQTAARKNNRVLREREQRENLGNIATRKKAIAAERDRRVKNGKQRIRTLERRDNKKMIPAVQGQIDKAEADYRAGIAELESGESVTVSLSEPLAICTVLVHRKDN